MVQLGCKTGYNLDGGGTTSFYYKKSGTTSTTQVSTAYDGRLVSEMLYFVE